MGHLRKRVPLWSKRMVYLAIVDLRDCRILLRRFYNRDLYYKFMQDSEALREFNLSYTFFFEITKRDYEIYLPDCVCSFEVDR